MIKQRPLKFENPFGRNGCTPVAFAHAGRLDADGVRLLAMYASERGLFSPRSRAGRSRTPEEFAFWAGLAGVREVQRIEFPQQEYVDGGGRWRTKSTPTLRRFLAVEAAHGTWLVYTAHHVQYVCNGVVFGYHRPHSRVQLAVEVRPA